MKTLIKELLVKILNYIRNDSAWVLVQSTMANQTVYFPADTKELFIRVYDPYSSEGYLRSMTFQIPILPSEGTYGTFSGGGYGAYGAGSDCVVNASNHSVYIRDLYFNESISTSSWALKVWAKVGGVVHRLLNALQSLSFKGVMA